MLLKLFRRSMAWLYSCLGSRWFFWSAVGLLLLQAAWIALSSLYPMAFDEEYHLGLIRLYAAHSSPFWDGQPKSANIFGSVATDPSYLYHWLMSFPYRAIDTVITSQTTQIIILRFINIGLFIAAMPIWRSVLRKMGANEPVTNATIGIFVLLPIVPLLAGQINYDNLLFLLVAGISLVSIQTLQKIKTDTHMPIVSIITMLTLCLMAALTKYAFLPLFVVFVIALMWSLWKRYTSFSAMYKDLLVAARREYKKSRYLSVGLLTVFLLVSLLFVQRDIGNVVRYHTPAPSCDAVLSVEDCAEYGPWNRDYNLAKNKQSTNYNPIAFSYDWVRGMWHRSIFTLAGPTVSYQTRGPLTAPAYTTIALGILVVGSMLVLGFRVYRSGNTALRLMISMSLVYILVLWLDGYEAYTRTGKAVAINGRYLLIVLLPLGVFAIFCIARLLGNRRSVKTLLATCALIGMAWGGGVGTFIIRSNETWYWPNTTVKTVNITVQGWLKPITPGSNKPTQFLP